MMFMKSFLMFIFIELWYHFNYCECKHYCDTDFCIDGKEHTLCKFQTPGPGKDCLNYEKLLKTKKDTQEILDKINQRRNKVASGDIRSLPSAANMLKMEWNELLETSAQRWADQCFNSSIHEMRDVCRDLENERVGQNVATIYGEAPGLTISSLVDIWYMELLNVNDSIVSRYRPSFSRFSEYDNFTQLVWAESNRVGCGAVKFTELKANQTVYRLVCNFAPSGNQFGDPIYEEGLPCSKCPLDRSNDAQFKNLCSKIPSKLETNNNKYLESSSFTKSLSLFEQEKTIQSMNSFKKKSTSEYITDEDTQLDFLSDLFEVTKAPFLITKSTSRCKDYLAVDEFIELLKSRLNNDQILRNLLAKSTQTDSPEPAFTDRTMAAMINQIYSSKETATTTKTTVNDYINSTLLVDLVEAVIFRHSNQISTTDRIQSFTHYAPDVSVVKVQAQTGEIKANNEFTGHYFFPEEEDSVETNIEDETTESYNDSDDLAVSEISLEIEELKRDKATKDFIEEILDSDLETERPLKDIITLTDFNIRNNESSKRVIINNNSEIEALNNVDQYRRRRRDINTLKVHSDSSFKFIKGGAFVTYKDLLRYLANDLQKLKLNDRFSCAHNSVRHDSFDGYIIIFIELIIFYAVCCVIH